MTKPIVPARGVLFVIEGIDGSGKTTQAVRLVETLVRKGYDARYLREPTDGVWGRKIRRTAREGKRHEDPQEEYRLFLLDRRENVKNNIAPALGQKKIVVLDRYYFSTMAYQGALGIDPDRIREENEAFAPIPDRVFYISLSVDEGLRRISQDRGAFTSFEEEQYLTKVKTIFDQRVACLPCAVTVNGMKGRDAVFEEIREGALEFLKTVTE